MSASPAICAGADRDHPDELARGRRLALLDQGLAGDLQFGEQARAAARQPVRAEADGIPRRSRAPAERRLRRRGGGCSGATRRASRRPAATSSRSAGSSAVPWMITVAGVSRFAGLSAVELVARRRVDALGEVDVERGDRAARDLAAERRDVRAACVRSRSMIERALCCAEDPPVDVPDERLLDVRELAVRRPGSRSCRSTSARASA